MSNRPVCGMCGRPAEYELSDYLSSYGYWCGEADCAEEIVKNHATALVNYEDEETNANGKQL